MGTEITEEESASLAAKIRARCTEDGDCLMWPGSTDSHGVPTVRVGGKVISARKLVLLAAGEWLDGRRAANTCGRSACLAEDHLGALTQQEVILLAVERTRYHLRPERNAKIAAHARKGNKLACPHLREEILNSDRNQYEEAALRGVSQSAVSTLKRGKTYRQYSSPFAGLFGARS